VKILKILLITIFIVALIVPILGCGTESDEAEPPETQIVAVQRGDLTIDIMAAGNLALSHTEDLAFDLFYQEGTVEEVLVEEGDIVIAGQVLASLDTEEWEEELSALEDDVTVEERDLLQTQINLITSTQNLKDAQNNEEAKELALLNAQISLDQANYNLEVAQETYTWPEIEIAKADIERLEAWLEYALESQVESSNSAWDRLVTRYGAELDAAERTLDALLEGYDTEEVAIKRKQVEAAEMSLSQAQKNLDEVAGEVAKKELEVRLKEVLVEDAQKALLDAQDELDEAKSKSPIITALFDGFITRVNVEGGDEVMTGTVAVQLADPNKFEAEIMVSEMDILQVKEGGEASVQVDAMSGISLPATVTHISPTATIQSGVVNYEIKIEVQSLEQAEEVIKQQQQGLQSGQLPAMMPENFQLREGLTVTVSILVDERTDVLMVPNSAITRRGAQSYVKVVSADGTIEERVIQTGISDWQYTEVTGGLSEGEQVVMPQGTTASSTTQQGRGGRPMPFLPPPH